MANISSIKLPNGTTYDLKDNVSGYITNAGVTSITTSAGAHSTKSSATGAVSFNVPTKTSHLTNDSGFLTSHQTLYEENIQWGPTSVSKSGNVSPIGMALSAEHSANRLAYINGAALDFEYSSNSGSSWTNYNYDAASKTAFCTTSYGVPIGRTSGNYSTSSRTRITLTAQNGTTGYVYTDPKKLLINISSSGGMNVLIEYRTGTNYQNNGSWTTFGTYTLSGWSGWNDIPLIMGTLGGGTNQTTNNWQLRLTFIMTSVNSNYPTTAQVNSIRLFGQNSWQATSNMGSTGHLYAYDASQNATFPAQVTATQFNGALNGTATNASKVNNLTVQTAVPANAVFTDSTVSTLTLASGSTAGTALSHGGKYTLTAGTKTVSFTMPSDNNTTYTFTNGTNGFTVTPSGGSAQTVTVTPSITNNVTGSGTSGQLAQWNGTNTLTNGPKVTISTSTPSGGTNGDIWFVYS